MRVGAYIPFMLCCPPQTLVDFAQFSDSVFYPLHTYLIKNPLQTKNPGAIMRSRKEHFQSPFHFLISLFSWTPRDRLVNDPGALHSRQGRALMRTDEVGNRFCPSPPGIVSLYDTWFSLRRCPHRQCVHGWSVFVTPLGTARYRFIVGMPPQAFRARLVCYR